MTVALLASNVATHRAYELLSVLVQLRVGVEQGHEIAGRVDIVDQLRVLFGQPEGRVPDLLLLYSDLLDGFVVEGLSAPHALWFVSGSLSSTPWTLHWGPILRFGRFDLFPLKPGVLGFGVLSEPGDVSGDGLTPTGAALSVLDQGGVCVSLLSQPVGVRLSKVRRGNGFRNSDSFRGFFEALEEPLIGVAFRFVQFRPQACVRVLARRMFGQPPLKVGDTEIRYKVDRPLSGLSVYPESQPVVGIGHIPHGEIVQFPAPQSSFILNANEGFIARVSGLLNHGFHVVFDFQHLRRVGDRIVVPGCFRGHPIDTRRRIPVLIGRDTLSKHAEGNSVIPVCFLVIVDRVNPPDDILRGVSIGEGGVQPAHVLRYASEVSEEFQVAVVTVFLSQEIELFTKSQQSFSVRVTLYVPVAVLYPVLQRLYLLAGIGHTLNGLSGKIVNICLDALHRLTLFEAT